MKHGDIEVGEVYIVNYMDPNYPCKCPCHTTPGIIHCMPCCFDLSYNGFATCLRPFDDGETHLFAIDTRHFLRLHCSSVLEAAPDEEAIAITDERTIEYISKILGVKEDE